MSPLYLFNWRKDDRMAKKKIKRLNKEWYVADEYGHTDKLLVIKVNELIGIINNQQEIIHDLELLLKNNGNGMRG